MGLDEAVEELYRGAPGDFVQTRRRLAEAAKAAGDAATAQQIKALRRPTVSAWAVNLLVRERPPLAREVLAFGERLREAWENGEDTAELDRARTPLIDRATRAAAALVEETGRPLGDQARQEVAETLYAAVSDADVAAEVASGRLTHPRAYVGFGLPGMFGETAEPSADDERVREGRPPSASKKKREKGGPEAPDDRRRTEEHQRAEEHRRAEERRAEERRREAERRRFEARRHAAELRAKADALAAERDQLRRALEDVEQEEETLRHRLDQVRVHRAAARKSFEEAEQLATAAAGAAAEAEAGLS
ncbi:hypothetical protein [Actinocorallia sp. A-T 12471]|uniref:hypothetical protein n=1 Tax=Actinocorallia sp. A-T 12471 TaxID=3089813 RepID=UPI0029CE1B88|nr:hypothetical protein [Actinocorallia sp. A-T 12471]MDX6740335.1 hypothetical protein [Actinocorallia sp. A-T 12471]